MFVFFVYYFSVVKREAGGKSILEGGEDNFLGTWRIFFGKSEEIGCGYSGCQEDRLFLGKAHG